MRVVEGRQIARMVAVLLVSVVALGACAADDAGAPPASGTAAASAGTTPDGVSGTELPLPTQFTYIPGSTPSSLPSSPADANLVRGLAFAAGASSPIGVASLAIDRARQRFQIRFADPAVARSPDYEVGVVVGAPDGNRTRATLTVAAGKASGHLDILAADQAWVSSRPLDAVVADDGLIEIEVPPGEAGSGGQGAWVTATAPLLGATVSATSTIFSFDDLMHPTNLNVRAFGQVWLRDAKQQPVRSETTSVDTTFAFVDQSLSISFTGLPPDKIGGVKVVSTVDSFPVRPQGADDVVAPYELRIDYADASLKAYRVGSDQPLPRRQEAHDNGSPSTPASGSGPAATSRSEGPKDWSIDLSRAVLGGTAKVTLGSTFGVPMGADALVGLVRTTTLADGRVITAQSIDVASGSIAATGAPGSTLAPTRRVVAKPISTKRRLAFGGLVIGVIALLVGLVLWHYREPVRQWWRYQATERRKRAVRRAKRADGADGAKAAAPPPGPTAAKRDPEDP